MDLSIQAQYFFEKNKYYQLKDILIKIKIYLGLLNLKDFLYSSLKRIDGLPWGKYYIKSIKSFNVKISNSFLT